MAYAFYPPSGGGGSGSGVTIYANFAAFPVSAPVGTLAIDASTGTLYEYFGGSWQVLAQLGTVAAGTAFQEIPSGAINNSNVTFTLAHTPGVNAALVLFQDGLVLDQGIDYTLAGNTITMTVPPNFAQPLYAVYTVVSGMSAGVNALNGATGNVNVLAGTGIAVATVGQNITISNTQVIPAIPYAGTVALGSGISSKAVVFTTALGSLPAVVCWLSSSNPAAAIISSMGSGISAAGFTAQLGSTTPDATYTLNWIASVAND